jgi:T-complex protein 1 subunit gamma
MRRFLLIFCIVKSQTFKSAIESACLLLRVDDIVSGMKKKDAGPGGAPQQGPTEDAEGLE